MARDNWKKRSKEQFQTVPLHKGPILPARKPKRLPGQPRVTVRDLMRRRAH